MNSNEVVQIIQNNILRFSGVVLFLAGILAGAILYRLRSSLIFKAYARIVDKTRAQDKENRELKERLKEVGNVLKRSELEEKLWHEEEADFIFKLQEKISLEFDRKIVGRHIVESVQRFFNARAVVLLLLRDDLLCVEAAAGIAEEKLREIRLREGDGISGFVMVRKEGVKVDNLSSEPYLSKKNKENYFTNEFISVPLVSQKKAHGVLNICGRNADAIFTKKDFALADSVARVSAIALEGIFLYEQLQDNYLKTIAALASAIDARDPYTKRHSENVTRYVTAIAGEMRLGRHQRETIIRAALLHDVGKIGISDAVLRKPARLDQEEFLQIKTHPVKGYDIVKSLSFLRESAALILHHHEHFDGSGYPDGLSGSAIELGARILAVADSFDAMTTDRPYRKALPVEEAVEELRKCKNTQFDPDVVEAFVNVLGQDPGIVNA